MKKLKLHKRSEEGLVGGIMRGGERRGNLDALSCLVLSILSCFVFFPFDYSAFSI
jgi:hypothetical protein